MLSKNTLVKTRIKNHIMLWLLFYYIIFHLRDIKLSCPPSGSAAYFSQIFCFSYISSQIGFAEKMQKNFFSIIQSKFNRHYSISKNSISKDSKFTPSQNAEKVVFRTWPSSTTSMAVKFWLDASSIWRYQPDSGWVKPLCSKTLLNPHTTHTSNIVIL